MRWLRTPLLHFVVGGWILFRLVHGGAATPVDAGPPRPVTLTASDVERLRAAYARETGRPASADDEAALVEHAVDEELLFREALARGLDRHDRSIRNWLVEQMRAVDESAAGSADDLYAQAQALALDRQDLVVRRILVQKMRLLASRTGERGPADDELHDFYERHAADYRQPDRLTFRHVFLRSMQDGDALRARAERLLAELRRTPDTARAGDPFPLPSHLEHQTRAQVAKLFGAPFADAIAGLAPGTWQGPVASAYGLHLVWLDAREPDDVPPLAAVRQRVEERWRDEERARRVAALVRELRARYPLHVESAAWRARRNA